MQNAWVCLIYRVMALGRWDLTLGLRLVGVSVWCVLGQGVFSDRKWWTNNCLVAATAAAGGGGAGHQ